MRHAHLSHSFALAALASAWLSACGSTPAKGTDTGGSSPTGSTSASTGSTSVGSGGATSVGAGGAGGSTTVSSSSSTTSSSTSSTTSSSTSSTTSSSTSSTTSSSGGSLWEPTPAGPIHFHWMIGGFTTADILAGPGRAGRLRHRRAERDRGRRRRHPRRGRHGRLLRRRGDAGAGPPRLQRVPGLGHRSGGAGVAGRELAPRHRGEPERHLAADEGAVRRTGAWRRASTRSSRTTSTGGPTSRTSRRPTTWPTIWRSESSPTRCRSRSA